MPVAPRTERVHELKISLVQRKDRNVRFGAGAQRSQPLWNSEQPGSVHRRRFDHLRQGQPRYRNFESVVARSKTEPFRLYWYETI